MESLLFTTSLLWRCPSFPPSGPGFLFLIFLLVRGSGFPSTSAILGILVATSLAPAVSVDTSSYFHPPVSYVSFTPASPSAANSSA